MSTVHGRQSGQMSDVSVSGLHPARSAALASQDEKSSSGSMRTRAYTQRSQSAISRIPFVGRIHDFEFTMSKVICSVPLLIACLAHSISNS